ncbi:MAG: response regulator [Patescibacteria group bacterium]
MPKILHFEDDKFLTGMYAIKFKKVGFEYVNYENPTKDPASIVKNEKPDLIIMDVIMPIMDGFEATKLIMADEAINTIPIIGFTSLSQELDVKRGMELGMKEYLVKAKFTPTQVVQKIGKMLDVDVKTEGINFPPIKPNYPRPSIQDDLLHQKKIHGYKKLYITLSIIAIIVLSAMLPPLLMPKVKSGIAISDELRDEILLAVDTHFDHPIERMAVLRYQITEMEDWQGEYHNRYIVEGRTIYGIIFNRVDAYQNGGIITVPTLENDLIIN